MRSSRYTVPTDPISGSRTRVPACSSFVSPEEYYDLAEEFDPENHLPDAPFDGWGESCQTWGEHWGYVESDDYEGHAWTLSTLAEMASLGANLLLNVGPKPDGTLPEQAYDRLDALADWLAHSAPAVKGVKAGPWPTRCDLPVTRDEGVWYVHVHPSHDSPVEIVDVTEPAGVRHLRTGDALAWDHDAGDLSIEVPTDRRQTPDEVVAVSWPVTSHHLL